MSKLKLPAKPGIYTLILDVVKPLRIEIGRLGRRDFAQGIYAYAGSAIGRTMNLQTRVSRHLAFEKKKRWHIDYLLGSEDVTVKDVIYVETSLKKECQIAKNIELLPEAKVPMRGFGSSDCRYGCASHLYHFPSLCLEEAISRVINVYRQVFIASQPVIFRVNSH